MALSCRILPLHNRLMNSFSPCNSASMTLSRGWLNKLSKLKLNDDKTEALTISAPWISNSIPLLDSLTVGNSTVRFSQSAKYLGVTLDMRLTMCANVVNRIRTANFELRRIISIRHYLSVQAPKTLVSAFVLSCLDYCNSFLSGCPQYLLNRLRKVQNNAARLTLKAPNTDHITFHLRTLHWLPTDARIKYKLCSLCFCAITSTGPVYHAIYSRFTHPLGNTDLPQTSVYCAFRLSTLSHTVNALSLTLVQNSETHFQKTSDFLSQFLPLDQHSRPTFFQHNFS